MKKPRLDTYKTGHLQVRVRFELGFCLELTYENNPDWEMLSKDYQGTSPRSLRCAMGSLLSNLMEERINKLKTQEDYLCQCLKSQKFRTAIRTHYISTMEITDYPITITAYPNEMKPIPHKDSMEVMLVWRDGLRELHVRCKQLTIPYTKIKLKSDTGEDCLREIREELTKLGETSTDERYMTMWKTLDMQRCEIVNKFVDYFNHIGLRRVKKDARQGYFRRNKPV